MATSWSLNWIRAALLTAAITPPVGAQAEVPPSAAVIAEVAKEFDRHALIMVGELHRWEQLHAFIRAMVRDREFICRVDDIVIEFGNARLQNVADDYAFGRNVSDT